MIAGSLGDTKSFNNLKHFGPIKDKKAGMYLFVSMPFAEKKQIDAFNITVNVLLHFRENTNISN